MLASRMASCSGVAAFCSTTSPDAAAGVANHAAVAGGIVHLGGQQHAGGAPAASVLRSGAAAWRRAAAGHRRRRSPGSRPAAARASRPTITAWPVPFCSVCSMKPIPGVVDGLAHLVGLVPTTTKIAPAGPVRARCPPRAPPASCRRRGAAPWPCAISCGCPVRRPGSQR